MRTLHENLAVRMIGTPAEYAAAEVDLEYVSMVGYQRVLFICGNGELDGNITIVPIEAEDENGTNAQAIGTAFNGTFTNGTDEARIGLIEVREGDLSEGYTHVTLRVTPAAADSFFAVAVLGDHNLLPVENGTPEGVAFVKDGF